MACILAAVILLLAAWGPTAAGTKAEEPCGALARQSKPIAAAVAVVVARLAGALLFFPLLLLLLLVMVRVGVLLGDIWCFYVLFTAWLLLADRSMYVYVHRGRVVGAGRQSTCTRLDSVAQGEGKAALVGLPWCWSGRGIVLSLYKCV